MKSDVARDISATSGGAVFDSIALADVAEAINGLTAAIVADTASDKAQDTSQKTAAIARFTEVMDRWEDDRWRQP
ncbi:hypothetical protein [Methylobacterium radiotolerans]